jgi:hypothetical protein
MGEDMEESNKTSTLALLSQQLASASLAERLTALETISLYVMGEDPGMEVKPVPLRAAGKFMLRMYVDGYYNEKAWREGVIGALCTTSHESPIDLFAAAQELLEDPKVELCLHSCPLVCCALVLTNSPYPYNPFHPLPPLIQYSCSCAV